MAPTHIAYATPPLRTPEDYQAALSRVSAYFDDEPEAGTPDGDHFKQLLAMVEAYEARHLLSEPELEGSEVDDSD